MLDAVAAVQPAPGAGVVAALTAAAAAGLTAMAAGSSRLQHGAMTGAQIRDDAEALRRRATELADADARAYAEVLDAERAGSSDDARERLTAALQAATDVPLELVDVARQVAGLAARLCVDGSPRLRGEARTAVELAAAVAASASFLVRANVRHGGLDDEPLRRAERWAADARDHLRALDRP